MLTAEAIEHLADYRIADILIENENYPDLDLQCVVRVAKPPFVEARFLPGQLSAEVLSPGASGRISCSAGMQVLSLVGRLDSRLDERRLRFEVEACDTHDDPRRHFRVDADVLLKHWPMTRIPPVEAEAKRVNISGSGIRFSTPTPLRTGQRVGLEITLPGTRPKVVDCQGKVVSVFNQGEDHRETALQIVEIKPEKLTSIIDFCMGKKFRGLRSKAEFLGEVLSPDLPVE